MMTLIPFIFGVCVGVCGGLLLAAYIMAGRDDD